jgi:hypothetical protein
MSRKDKLRETNTPDKWLPGLELGGKTDYKLVVMVWTKNGPTSSSVADLAQADGTIER